MILVIDSQILVHILTEEWCDRCEQSGHSHEYLLLLLLLFESYDFEREDVSSCILLGICSLEIRETFLQTTFFILKINLGIRK